MKLTSSRFKPSGQITRQRKRVSIPDWKGSQALSVLHQISGCEQPNRKADVIFVHGLGGGAFTTWRHGDDESTSWPHWLGQEFPEVGVWSLGYAASPS